MASSADMALNMILSLKDEASEKLGGMKEKLGGVKLAALGIAGAAVAGIGALTAGLISAGKAAAEEEVGVQRLAAAVTASGGNWDTASTAIENYLTKELARTALDDGAGREAISRLTTATGDYQQALDLMGLAQDLSAAKGIDLASAAEIVGKVANGNTSALSRYGIVLEEGATAQEALAAMQATFAGQAEAYGNTTAGAQQKMDIAFGNLKETVGGFVLPVMTKFATIMADIAQRAIPIVQGAIEGLIGFWNQNKVAILAGFAALAVAILVTVIPSFIAWATAAGTAAIATITALAPVVLPIIAIGAAVALLVAAWENDWGGIRTFLLGVWEGTLRPVFEAIKAWFEVAIPTALGVLKGVWDSITNALANLWNNTLKPAIKAVWQFIQDYVIPIFTSLADVAGAVLGVAITVLTALWTNVLQPALETAWDWLKKLWEIIKDSLSPVLDTLGGWFNTLAGIVRDTVMPILITLKENILDKLQTVFDGIKTAIGGVVGFLSDLAASIRSLVLPAWLQRLLGIADGGVGPTSGAAIDQGAGLARDLAEGFRRGGGEVARAVKEVVEDALAAGREVAKSMWPLIVASSETMTAYNRLAAKEGGIITAEGTERLGEREALGRTDIIGGRREEGESDIGSGRGGGDTSASNRGGGSSELIIRLYWNDNEAGNVTANLIDGESKSVTLNVVAGVL